MTVTERSDWTQYRGAGDLDARNRLVERHLPLVHHFAQRMRARTPETVEPRELVSAGVVGLMEAVGSFDPDRGYRFSTFAGSRIRGAMLDEMRRRDVAPRSVRRRQRRMASARERLAVELDRVPGEAELARVLEVDPQTLWRWRWDVARSRPVSLSELASGAEAGDRRVREPASDGEEAVEERLTREAELLRLRREIARLSERERLIIDLYDMGSLTLREVADRLGVTESRVSQIRKRALGRLRARMQDLREAA